MFKKTDIEGLRASWGGTHNHRVGEANQSDQVDHRSLEAQHLDSMERAKMLAASGDEEAAHRELDRAEALLRPPQTHLGPAVWNMEKRAIETARKLGVPYEPVTDRLREALEAGTAPKLFVDAYRDSRQ